MSRIVFITGGSRSGKSNFALEMAKQWKNSIVFLATSPKLDPEMESRIQRHQNDRAALGWTTIEEEFNLVKAIEQLKPETLILLDCIGLWVNNLLYKNPDHTEDAIKHQVLELVNTIRKQKLNLIAVSNETGMGLIGDSSLNRKFVDLLGRANQTLAQEAHEAYFLVSGISLKLKENHDESTL